MFRGTKFYLLDIGAATEHIVLEAEDLELGTCWIGWFNESGVKKALSIPDKEKVDVLIALGYFDEKALGKRNDKEPLEKLASFNEYR